MIITDYAVKRRTTVFVLMFLFLISGVYAYIILPREAAPDIPIPIILVMTGNRGVGPEDIEKTITIEMEKEFEGLDDLKKLTSVSSEGMSTVVLEFHPSIEIEEAKRKVKDAADTARGRLPQEADDPLVKEINVSEFPIMVLSIHGKADGDRLRNLTILKKVADELKDAIEMVPGVLEVERAGGLTPEVRIEIDPDQLAAYRIPAELLVARYLGEDVKISAGSTDFGNLSYDIRIPMEFERDIESAKNIVILERGEEVIYLGDLARIVPGYEEEKSTSRFNGEEAVSLLIQKKSGENILHTAAGVKAVMQIAKESGRIPQGIEVDLTFDLSEFIQMLVNDLDNNIATGFFLVVGVVFLVLGIRNSLFVALAIPFSFLITLTVLWFMGITLNFVVLFSLILSLGLLVDNAIVIVENIFRHQQMGYGKVEAAILGTKEVAWPITTSTMTTLAAFGPLLFWPGIMGKFFGFLPQTVIIALISSLFVGLVINPAACAAFMNVSKKDVWGSGGRKLGKFLLTYRRVLRASIRWKWAVAGGSFLVLILMSGVYFGSQLGIEFFPNIDPQRAFVDISMPESTRLNKTNGKVIGLERGIREVDKAGDIEQAVSSVGSRGTSHPLSTGGGDPSIARISLEFKDIDKRTVNSRDLIEILRERFSDFTGGELRVEKEEMGPPTGAAVNLEITGEDYTLLGELASKAKRIVQDVPGVADLRDDFEVGRPELKIIVDRKRAALLGLNPLLIGLTIQTAYMGRKVGVVRSGEEEFDVRVIAKEEERHGFGMLDKLYLTSARGGLVPASAVASWKIQGGKGSIRHIERDRVVTLSSDVAKGFLADAVRKEVKEALVEFETNLPSGYKLRLTGEQEMQEEAQEFLSVAFVAVVFFIALILISQFNSLRLPLIILSSILLSLVGVFLGLFLLRMPFGVVMTGIGVISLAGVVVNNAIVLIDYIQKLRQRGLCAFDAVVEAGITRLRPVLLTAVTTIFGLLPMAIGISFDFHKGKISLAKEMAQWWGPMAIAVIFGLGVATVLTLVVVPTLYAVLMGVKEETPGPDAGTAPTCEEPHTGEAA
ncbi:MAG: efflux RND transporter permease subunit [Planctomycetota bacterium]|jgi:multidrug efflux pump subunit AcrB